MAVTLLQLRVFYAMKDARTPTLLQIGMVAVRVPLLLLVPVVVRPEDVVAGLMLVTSITYVAGWVFGDLALRRRLGSLRTRETFGPVARIAAVSAVAGGIGWLVLNVTDDLLGAGVSRLARAGADRYRGHRRRGSRGSRGRPRSGDPGTTGSDQGPEGARMTGSSRDDTPPPGQSPRRPGQERGSTVSMTSTATGLPDRYRPLDQVGPDEPTATGVIRSWRAKDRVLNRDVAIRVHTPAGPAAHAWISRALTAGGLATPALAMVYDASEGIGAEPDDDTAGGGDGSAAYVVNEWIDGETLAERLARGPMPEREVRVILRRLADGVAEAHRVGLAVGGLSLDNVVLRPNGLVGLRAVPAATGTIDGDIAALGALLEACLTGLHPADARAATAHRLLRPRGAGPPRPVHRTGPGAVQRGRHGGAAGRTAPQRIRTPDRPVRRHRAGGHRQRLAAAAARPQGGRHAAAAEDGPSTASRSAWTRTPCPRCPASGPSRGRTRRSPPPRSAATPSTPAWSRRRPAPTRTACGRRHTGPGTPPTDDGRSACSGTGPRPDDYDDGYDDLPPEDEEDGAKRHRLVVIGLPLLALALVVALAWWIGNALLSVSGRHRRHRGLHAFGERAGGWLGRDGPRRDRGHDRRRRGLRPAG